MHNQDEDANLPSILHLSIDFPVLSSFRDPILDVVVPILSPPSFLYPEGLGSCSNFSTFFSSCCSVFTTSGCSSSSVVVLPVVLAVASWASGSTLASCSFLPRSLWLLDGYAVSGLFGVGTLWGVGSTYDAILQ